MASGKMREREFMHVRFMINRNRESCLCAAAPPRPMAGGKQGLCQLCFSGGVCSLRDPPVADDGHICSMEVACAELLRPLRQACAEYFVLVRARTGPGVSTEFPQVFRAGAPSPNQSFACASFSSDGMVTALPAIRSSLCSLMRK